MLDYRPVSDFLSWIKALIDALASVGDAATYRKHMDSILDRLPRDFDLTITLIESHLPHITVEEVEG